MGSVFYSWENIFSQLDKSNGVSLKINFSRAFCPISGRFLQELCPKCCAKACTRRIIELRKKGPKGRRVYVQCVNKDKGAVAKKACAVACIGCGKCQKVCRFEAITVENNLAYIDFNKCRLCTKCVDECPTGALVKINFPVRTAV